MFISCKGRWPMECDISQVLHAVTWHVCMFQATSANNLQCQQRPTRVILLCVHRLCDFSRGISASAMACVHFPRDNGQWKEATAKACMH
uniref:Uncharacterized protein n=1 Tax=Solanum lycopersicum TaxID=4081 RepID=A0A3Q7J929_SOLLC